MEKIIEEILSDLYALDKDLRQYDKALRNAIEKIIEARPDTQFDENFKLELRKELLAKAELLKADAKENSLQAKVEILLEKTGEFFGQFSQTRWVYALPMLVLVVGVAFWQYGQNGGGYLIKQDVSFALAPNKTDVAGIEPDASFVLKASKDLSEATIKKTVSFKPAVDFSVTKIKKLALGASPALAADQANAQDLPYQYEIKPTGELEKGKVYQVAIANEQIADRDYQWAFQIKAPFGVTETFPAKKATSVPSNSGIEIQFNRNLPENAGEYFEISPKVEGSFEVKMDRLYFKPQKLDNLKIYTVTIKQGLVSKDDGEILKEDYVFSFEALEGDGNFSDSDKISFEDRTNMYTEKKIVEVTPQMQPLIKFDVYQDYYYSEDKKQEKYEAWLEKITKNKKVSLEVYKLDSSDEFRSSYTNSQNWNLTWSKHGGKKPVETFQPEENKKILSISAEENEGGILQLPENLAEGYYFFKIKKEIGKKMIDDYGWIVVSRIAQYSSLQGNTGLIWAYDFENRKPLEQAEISFLEQKGNLQNLAKSNEKGLAKFDLPETLKNNPDEDNIDYGPQFFKLAGNGFEKIMVANIEKSVIKRADRYWEVLTIDKTKYHPTDKINFWGVLKNRRGEDLTKKKLKIGIFENSTIGFSLKNAIISQEVEISKFDTVTGSIQFTGLPIGYYGVTIFSAENEEIYSQANFEVANYQKPSYQIEVQAEQDAVYAGQEVAVKVKANFFDGTPVSNLELAYTIIDQSAYNSSLSSDETERGEEIKEKKEILKLDENGTARVVHRTIVNKKTKLTQDYCRFTFEPVLGEEFVDSFSASVDVFNSTVGIKAENQEAEKNKFEIVLSAFALDPQRKLTEEERSTKKANYDYGYNFDDYIHGLRVDQKINAKLIRQWQEKTQTGQEYDYISKKQQATYEYEDREEVVEEFEGITDQNGQWKFSKEIKPQNPLDSYKLVFNGIDGQGNSFQMEDNVFYGNYPYYSVVLNINKKVFKSGERVHLEVIENSPEDAPIVPQTLFYRYQNDIDGVVVENGKTFEEEFSESFAPNVSYIGVVLTKYGFQETESVFAGFDEKTKELKLEITLEKENYRPGEEVRAKLALKDVNGQPVSTQVNVSVIDQALLEQDDEINRVNILRDLYSHDSGFPVTAYTEYLKKLNSDGGRGGGGDPRRVFMDIPYYQNLETDAEGKAQIVFKLPDNLTGWVINARAFDTKQMMAGQAQKVISAGLPFFVDTVLNENYLTGDNPQIKVRFFGQEYQAGNSVDYAVKIKDLNFEQKASTTNLVAYVSLGALPVGEHEIEISAKQGDKEDKLIRKISVKDSYFSKSESVAYDLSENLKNIQTGENNFTELVFVDKGKGKFFGFLNGVVETGGSRLDQVTANFMAEKLLAENYYQQKFKKDLDLSDFYGEFHGDNSEKTGLSLFGSYGEPNLENSAKVADAVPDATDKDNLKSYFSRTLIESRTDIHRIAKALYGLACLGEPVLSKINAVKVYEKDLAIDDKIYLALALAKQGDLEGARTYYDTEIKSAIKIEGEQAWLEAGDIPVENEKLTATLGILTARLNDQTLTEKIWNYLESHRPQRDLNILEKVLMVEEQLKKIPTQKASFELKTNKRNEKITLINGQSASLRLSKDEINSLEFSKVEGSIQVLSIFENSQTQFLQNDKNFEIARTFSVENKKGQNFSEGDLVKVSFAVKLKEGARGENYQLRDSLPSGLRPVAYQSEDWYYFGEDDVDYCNSFWYPEKIDNNQVYFSLNKQEDFIDNKCQNLTINYYARVISKGVFKADAAMLQSTEDFGSYFVTPVGQVEIK
ncbi:MAG: Ig-like domain-containing protein [Candidatus Moraniibacteriota bacterium]